MKKADLKLFEVYTLMETIPIYAEDLFDAIKMVTVKLDSEDEGDQVIGIIEVKLFHKGAVQKPDLI